MDFMDLRPVHPLSRVVVAPIWRIAEVQGVVKAVAAGAGVVQAVVGDLSFGIFLLLIVIFDIYKVGSKKIKAMKGIGRRMPVTSLCFVIGAFSLVGLPPFIGFPSKFIIVKSALLIHEGYFYFLVGGVLLGTVIEISYFFKLLQGIFSRTSNTKIDEAPLTALVPIVVLTLLIIGIGVYPQIINNFLKLASANLIDRMGYVNQVLGAL